MSEIIQKQDYKQTEVGLIPGDWDLFNLSNVLYSISDVDHYMPKTVKNGVPYVMTGDLRDFASKIDFDGCKKITKKDYQKLSKKIKIAEGDIILARYATIGTVSFVNVNIDFIVSYSCVTVKPYSSKLFGLLLNYYFKSNIFKLEVKSNVNANIQENIGIGDLFKLRIPLPRKLTEQRAIATALSDVDALLTSLEQLISKKQAIKQGAMQELLTPPNQGGKRLPGFSGEWEEKNLESICYISGGGTPSTAVLEYWNGEIEWFTPTEIGDQKYVFSSHRKITRTGLKSSSANLLPIGSILLTSRASIGDLAILKKEASTNQGFQSLIPIRKEDSEFIYQLMLTKKTDLMNLSSGSTFLEISPKKVRSLKILIPKDTIERETIAQILSEMDKEIKALEEKKDKYQKIKGGMMQELLTGKIRLV